MTDQTFKYLAMAIYMIVMLGIGWYAWKKTNNLDDYMLAGRGLRPGVAALSAGASDMSGWLLMGLPGAIYLSGLSQIWMAVGLTIGAYLNWKFVAPRLRSYTEVSNNSITLPSFFENRLKDKSRILRVVAGVIILAFFTFYVSSGMVAGGVFFESSFDSKYWIGMLVVGGITILYTLFGGFMGATFTDVAQGIMMFLALIIVPIMGLVAVGGFGGMMDSINNVDPSLASIGGGTLLGGISAAAWGLGYFGQPHIVIRFMALRNPQDAKPARRIGVSWMVVSIIGAVMTALVGIAYFQQNPEFTLTDPEAVFLDLAQIFFHPLIGGLVLAAVLAAIMSTISSQLIVCSSALVEDLYNMVAKKTLSAKQGVMLGRAGVLLVALVAISLAAGRSQSILDLVAFAWAGFGAAFGPLMLLALYWRKLTMPGALSGMVVGAATVFIWGNIDVLKSTLYEIIPGFILCTIVAIVVSKMTYKFNAEIDAEFDEAIRRLDGKAWAEAQKEPATAQN